MRRDPRKEKAIYITAAAVFVVLAIALMALLLRGPASAGGDSEEPARTAGTTASPSPTAASGDTITIGSKTVGVTTDSFDLSGRTLTNADRDAIASLKNLTTLSLTKCGITDVSFLSGLTSLTTLYLPENSITDLTPLTRLAQLKTLYLDNNPLTDLTPLTELTNLATLSIQGVKIADYALDDLQKSMPQCHIFNDSTVEEARPISLGGLAFTEDVETLDLSNRGIADISKLSYCLKLQDLNLAGNPLESLNTLLGLPKLTTLNLSNTGLTDSRLDTLRSLSRLTALDVSANPALTAEGLDKLQEALPHCAITHDEVFYTIELGGESLTSDMTEVELSGRGISALTGLEKFEKLRRLALYGNGIADLSPLKGLTALEELDLGYNNIADISALSGHTGLRVLKLSHNSVRDIYALATCTGLQELDLSYNNLDYLSHLTACTALVKLDLTGNPALTADQIRRLQEALPNCVITTDVVLATPTPTPTEPAGAVG